MKQTKKKHGTRFVSHLNKHETLAQVACKRQFLSNPIPASHLQNSKAYRQKKGGSCVGSDSNPTPLHTPSITNGESGGVLRPKGPAESRPPPLRMLDRRVSALAPPPMAAIAPPPGRRPLPLPSESRSFSRALLSCVVSRRVRIVGDFISPDSGEYCSCKSESLRCSPKPGPLSHCESSRIIAGEFCGHRGEADLLDADGSCPHCSLGELSSRRNPAPGRGAVVLGVPKSDRRGDDLALPNAALRRWMLPCGVTTAMRTLSASPIVGAFCAYAGTGTPTFRSFRLNDFLPPILLGLCAPLPSLLTSASWVGAGRCDTWCCGWARPAGCFCVFCEGSVLTDGGTRAKVLRR